VVAEAGESVPALMSVVSVKFTVLFFTRLLLASRTTAVIRLFCVVAPPCLCDDDRGGL